MPMIMVMVTVTMAMGMAISTKKSSMMMMIIDDVVMMTCQVTVYIGVVVDHLRMMMVMEGIEKWSSHHSRSH